MTIGEDNIEVGYTTHIWNPISREKGVKSEQSVFTLLPTFKARDIQRDSKIKYMRPR